VTTWVDGEHLEQNPTALADSSTALAVIHSTMIACAIGAIQSQNKLKARRRESRRTGRAEAANWWRRYLGTGRTAAPHVRFGS
jgi:hypothetical protein